MKKVFLGIDFSKSKFDAVITNGSDKQKMQHHEFENSVNGCNMFIKWACNQTQIDPKQWLICGEHTGLYSITLTEYMNTKGIDIWLESGLQIKRSLGLVRGKNDKIDAYQIAWYAYRFQDKAQKTILKVSVLDQLKDLMNYAERLKTAKHSLLVSSKELNKVKNNSSVDFIFEDSLMKINQIDQTIKQIDKRMEELISQQENLNENYQLLQSVKGIGSKNAIMLLILTGNFTQFTEARKFGCYCGVVPFQHLSGSSIKTKDRVSHLANKKMKTLLTQAAQSAIRHDMNMKEYYHRKLKDGKQSGLIINNIRNKLIHVVFAIIKSGTPYDPQYKNPIKNIA